MKCKTSNFKSKQFNSKCENCTFKKTPSKQHNPRKSEPIRISTPNEPQKLRAPLEFQHTTFHRAKFLLSPSFSTGDASTLSLARINIRSACIGSFSGRAHARTTCKRRFSFVLLLSECVESKIFGFWGFGLGFPDWEIWWGFLVGFVLLRGLEFLAGWLNAEL